MTGLQEFNLFDNFGLYLTGPSGKHCCCGKQHYRAKGKHLEGLKCINILGYTFPTEIIENLIINQNLERLVCSDQKLGE